jgi:aprataxin
VLPLTHAPNSALPCPAAPSLPCPTSQQDFDSSGLKNKKHWNSFTSPFFLDADWAAEQLRAPAGRLQYSLEDREALLKGELRCHRCGAVLSSMPRLKEHIAKCAAELPGQ